MKTAVVVLGHGSRAEEANQGLRDLAVMIKEMGRFELVVPAFLGHGQPNLPAVLTQLASDGAERIIVVPIFLFRGVHMSQDIPEEIAQVQAALPHVQIIFARHLGPDPRLAALACDRIWEVI